MAKKKRHINSLRQFTYFRDMINKVSPEKLEQDIIQSLSEYGKRLVKLAYLSSTFKDRTYNLHDSYVCAVFNKGRLVKGAVHYAGPAKSGTSLEYDMTASGDPEQKTGREEAALFLSKWSFAPGRPQGITLVIAATMFYSGILESRGYAVISQITDELEVLSRLGIDTMKYKAHIDEEFISEPSIFREGGMGRMEIVNT